MLVRKKPSPSKVQKKYNATRLVMQSLEDRTTPSWVAQVGGTGFESLVVEPIMDAAGNSYLFGAFSQTVDFDPGPGVFDLSAYNGSSEFVAKYDASGTFLWARQTSLDWGNGGSITPDPTGSAIYLCGGFQGPTDFTGDNVPDVTSNNGSKDAVVCKLDATNGQTLWVRTVGSINTDRAIDVATDGVSVYVVGGFGGVADFDPGPTTRNLTPTGLKGNSGKTSQDGFVWKLDANGNYVSAWQIGSTAVGGETVTSIGLDAGGFTVFGHYEGTVDFDFGPGVQSRKGPDYYMARYTPSGGFLWVNDFPVSALMTGDAGFLYLNSSFSSTIDLDPGPGTANLTPTGGTSDSFLAKYSKANGTFVWAHQFGGPGGESAGICLPDPANDAVYLGLQFSGAYVDVDLTQPGGVIANAGPVGTFDAVLVKLDGAGNYIRSWSQSGPGNDGAIRPMGVFEGTLYASSWFYGTTTVHTGDTLTSNGDRDVYLMAIDNSGPESLHPSSGSTPKTPKPADPLQGVFLGGVAVDAPDLLDPLAPARPLRGRVRF